MKENFNALVGYATQYVFMIYKIIEHTENKYYDTLEIETYEDFLFIKDDKYYIYQIKSRRKNNNETMKGEFKKTLDKYVKNITMNIVNINYIIISDYIIFLEWQNNSNLEKFLKEYCLFDEKKTNQFVNLLNSQVIKTNYFNKPEFDKKFFYISKFVLEQILKNNKIIACNDIYNILKNTKNNDLDNNEIINHKRNVIKFMLDTKFDNFLIFDSILQYDLFELVDMILESSYLNNQNFNNFVSYIKKLFTQCNDINIKRKNKSIIKLMLDRIYHINKFNTYDIKVHLQLKNTLDHYFNSKNINQNNDNKSINHLKNIIF